MSREYFFSVPQDFLKPQQATPEYLLSLCDTSEPTGRYLSMGLSLEYYRLRPRSHEAFKNLHTRRVFPKELAPDRVRVAQIAGGPGQLLPHRDHGVQCVLNVYLQANPEDSTVFYQPRGSAQAQTYPDKTTSNIYRPEDLEPRARINPAQGEAWLLDVSEIHSVEQRQSLPRVFLSYMWTQRSFQEISKLWP